MLTSLVSSAFLYPCPFKSVASGVLGTSFSSVRYNSSKGFYVVSKPKKLLNTSFLSYKITIISCAGRLHGASNIFELCLLNKLGFVLNYIFSKVPFAA